MNNPRIRIIGDQINSAYARARKAWEARDPSGYQRLAVMQADKGAEVIDLSIDGTARLSVRQEEMLAFLPVVVPAIQAVTDVPICFDNPGLEYHRAGLKAFDRSKSRGKLVLNSLAASRAHLDEMIRLVRDHDARCIVMASEKFLPGGGGAQCFHPQESYESALRFVDLLVTQAGRTLDDIILRAPPDPTNGLAGAHPREWSYEPFLDDLPIPDPATA